MVPATASLMSSHFVSDKDVIDDSVIVHKTDSSEIDESDENLAMFQRIMAS